MGCVSLQNYWHRAGGSDLNGPLWYGDETRTNLLPQTPSNVVSFPKKAGYRGFRVTANSVMSRSMVNAISEPVARV